MRRHEPAPAEPETYSALEGGSSGSANSVQSPEPTSKEMGALLSSLSKRVDTLDEKFNGIADKMKALQLSMDNFMGVQKPKPVGVIQHPLQNPTATLAPETDPSDFTNDEGIEKYRNAMVLFDGAKYPEAILEFSSFMKMYGDHPLVGSAQYYIGESYYKQKEYKLALDEYKRVVTSYDQSSHVPDALKRMAEIEDLLHLTKASARHRQLLLSLFPQSPAAQSVMETKSLPKTNPAPNLVEAAPVKGESLPTAPVPDVPATKQAPTGTGSTEGTTN